MTVDLRDARARFERALGTAGATHPGDSVFDELVSRHGEAHRHYHTLAHVDACLVWLDWFCGGAERAAEVELALWFHDAVYDPGASYNERRSAELARERLGGLGIPREAVDRIARYIEATQSHDATDGDCALVIDLDLSILGAARTDFERFEQRIREEYVHVPTPLYRLGRRQVLTRFLARPTIYKLPAIREELETPARTNLERALAP